MLETNNKRYLFFDIECCNGYDMCTFGYVIIDANFNIIECDDIVMNPRKKFKVSRGGFDPWQSLAYSEEYIRQQKPFQEHYSKIKNLLTATNQVILGHAVGGDIGYLKLATKKSKCQPIKFRAYDTQKIYSKSVSNPQPLGLEKIATNLNIQFDDIKLHKSCDDAKLSMLIVKALCKKLNCSLDELINSTPCCIVKSISNSK